MITRILLFVAAAELLVVTPLLAGEDWITAPSYYSHDNSGRRVAQHTPIAPVYRVGQEDLQRSGYRHTRSSLQFGGSTDHFHLVEEWGRAVRPYDEWRFPFRPYSVPYEAWGPPFAGAFGYPVYPYGPGPWGGGAGGNLNGPPFQPGINQFRPSVPYPGYRPWFDDRYPAFDDRAPWRHQPFPIVPPIP